MDVTASDAAAYCLGGARLACIPEPGFASVGAVHPNDETAILSEYAVRLAIEEATGERSEDSGGIVGWNDAPERTQAEAVAVAERGAAICRERQPRLRYNESWVGDDGEYRIVPAAGEDPGGRYRRSVRFTNRASRPG